MNRVYSLFKHLLKIYGPQGWWPLLNNKNDLVYHPSTFTKLNILKKFEVCVGAILTQNTAWSNVVISLKALNSENLLTPSSILKTDMLIIKKMIRPSGYYNQKYRKLVEFSKFFISEVVNSSSELTRKKLLSVWGIGRETADSILLYAFNKPFFIVDTYTRRVFDKHNLFNDANINNKSDYDNIRFFVENALPKDFKIYQEFHALIVAEAKTYKNR